LKYGLKKKRKNRTSEKIENYCDRLDVRKGGRVGRVRGIDVRVRWDVRVGWAGC
jgi:hypothetical protein